MTPRQDVSAERRNQILNAAVKVFTRFGFQKARMDDIVAESGLSKGTLYWYFKSKDAIILAILRQLFNREFESIRKLQHSDGPAIEKLEGCIDAVVDDLSKMANLMPIAFEFLSQIFRNKAVRQAVREYFDAYNNLIIPIIQQGIDEGEFRPVDPYEASLAIGAIIEGTIMLWVYSPDTVDIPHHSRKSCQLLLTGLRAH